MLLIIQNNMKTFIALFITAFIFLSFQSCNNSKKADSADLTPLTVTMDIQGMTCNGCVETVRASVAQIGDGINSVKVDLEKAFLLNVIVICHSLSTTQRSQTLDPPCKQPPEFPDYFSYSPTFRRLRENHYCIFHPLKDFDFPG